MALEEYTQVALVGQKIAASLTAALGIMCLTLSALGLYSVMSYAVSQRSHEFGIRIAMGAQPFHVISMVIREGMTMALAGLALGTAAAYMVSRLVAHMLIRLDAFDPATFAGAVVFVATTTLFATWIPARRATRIDPMEALRE